MTARLKRIGLFCLLTLLAGCAPVLNLPQMHSVPRDHWPEWFKASSPFPAECNATQRIVLTVNDKEYDFTGSLQKENGEIRAVALAEMGSLFLYLRLTDEDTEIVKNPSGLPEHPLRDGVAGDIRFLFNRDTLAGDWNWWQNAQGTLLVQRNRQRQIVWQADSAGRRIAGVTEAENNRKIRSVQWSDYRYFDSVDRILPAMMIVRNFRWHYTLRVQLLAINPLKRETP